MIIDQSEHQVSAASATSASKLQGTSAIGGGVPLSQRHRGLVRSQRDYSSQIRINQHNSGLVRSQRACGAARSRDISAIPAWQSTNVTQEADVHITHICDSQIRTCQLPTCTSQISITRSYPFYNFHTDISVYFINMYRCVQATCLAISTDDLAPKPAEASPLYICKASRLFFGGATRCEHFRIESILIMFSLFFSAYTEA